MSDHNISKFALDLMMSLALLGHTLDLEALEITQSNEVEGF